MTQARLTIELSNDMVKEAVADWLNTKGEYGKGWTPECVTLSVEARYTGYGTNEVLGHVPAISAARIAA